jgi:transcription elongation factor GreA
MSTSKFPLTMLGAEKMRAELQDLKTVQRPTIIAAIAEARAHGDLSENAEYHAAKERQSFIEGRIADLEGKLGNAQIIDPTQLEADGRCVFGSTIELEELDKGEVVTYQIVGEDEADIKVGKISVSSPLARALIGKSAGDVAEVMAPGGVHEYEIRDVKYV